MNRSILVMLGSLTLTACGGGDPPAPYRFDIRFVGVVENAVDTLEVRLRARGDERFGPQEPRSYAGGALTTEVTSDGQFVLRATGEWVRANSQPDPNDIFARMLLVPLYTTSRVEAMDPQVFAFVIRRNRTTGADEYIAEGSRFAEWPLVSGRTDQLRVECKVGFSRQCTNNDPFPDTDASVDLDAGGDVDGGADVDAGAATDAGDTGDAGEGDAASP